MEEWRLRKFPHKYKGSMPKILNTIVNEALEFNRANRRGLDKQRSRLCVCYALCGNKLLTIGYNRPQKTHPFCKEYADNLKWSIHAECDTIMKLHKMNKMDYVTDLVVIRGCTKPCNSYPCSICEGMLKMYFNSVRLWYYEDGSWKVQII